MLLMLGLALHLRSVCLLFFHTNSYSTLILYVPLDTLLVDTGSSNTWVGADQAFVPTSSSVDTGNLVSVTYGSRSFSGEECKLDLYLTTSSLLNQMHCRQFLILLLLVQISS